MHVQGWIIDWDRHGMLQARLTISHGRIQKIEQYPETFQKDLSLLEGKVILPGLIDAHVHIESSMLTPARFAEQALRWGTVATVSDPHEIANVLGLDGVQFMLENGRQVPLKFHFTFPSCVPATDFESAGARLDSGVVEAALESGHYIALGEMMNYPGVVYQDEEVMKKIRHALKNHLPIDGHAPGLHGEMLRKYVEAGIQTDHECSTLVEALEKIQYGMKILIREGSAARNFEALAELIDLHPHMVMLCCDDLHPDNLCEGHIDSIIRRGIRKGLDPINVIRAATINPHKHYGLSSGILREGDPADFIVVDNLNKFNVTETWIDGTCVYRNETVLCPIIPITPINIMQQRTLNTSDFGIRGEDGIHKVIRLLDGELLTELDKVRCHSREGYIQSDIDVDVLKISVVNRYHHAPPANALIRGFGLKKGALASTIAHDSHNIIVVGVNDADMLTAVNALMAAGGGIAIAAEGEVHTLSLPVAGLMSHEKAEVVAEGYRTLSDRARRMGSKLQAPFMTLSFMALLVIPKLKIGDKGLFDGNSFTFTSILDADE